VDTTRPIDLIDLHPAQADLEAEALRGLTSVPKTLPCKLFYDQRGSELFEAICELPEYYPTRAETAILRNSMDEITAVLGPRVQLIEPGSGAGTKTRLLLDALEDPVSYVPIDISKEHLREAAESIRRSYPDLQVQAVCADFVQPFHVPEATRPARCRVIFFPGSTIGNFHPDEAREFLGRMADLAGPSGGLLIGFDRRKKPETLIAAYDDAQGVTAEFNLNVLHRLNLDVGTAFPLDKFDHRARWNEEASRIEMHLVSQIDQTIRVGETEVHFAQGESIRTECCYKYGAEGVAGLTDRFELVRSWTDETERFGVQYLATTSA
jgi:L-histidine N-alpha-methyltransferase